MTEASTGGLHCQGRKPHARVLSEPFSFNNNAGLSVGGNCTLDTEEAAPADDGVTLDGLNVGTNKCFVATNGTWTANGDVSSKLPLEVIGGTLRVSKLVTISFQGALTDTDPSSGQQISVGSVYAKNSTVEVAGGATVVAKNGVTFTNTTFYGNFIQQSAANNVATIDANLVMNGGSVRFEYPDPVPAGGVTVFGQINVTGGITLNGTEYWATVDLSTNGRGGVLSTNKAIYIKNVNIIVNMYSSVPAGGDKGFDYMVIQAQSGTVGPGPLVNGSAKFYDLRSVGGDLEWHEVAK